MFDTGDVNRVTESPFELLNLSTLIEGGHTLLLRLDPGEAVFQTLNRASCDQLDQLLNLPTVSVSGDEDSHFTVIRTAYGNLPVLGLPITQRNPATVKMLISKLRVKKIAFSEKNLGDLLPEMKKTLKSLSEVNVWNAI